MKLTVNKILFLVIGVIFVAISSIAVIAVISIRPLRLFGKSMEPTLKEHQYLFSFKYSLLFPQNLSKGIIVTYNRPNHPSPSIGRVIALPNDKVSFDKGAVEVNSQLENEPYVQGKTLGGKILVEGKEYIVPRDSYLILGDNRERSSDSRDIGFITNQDVVGQIVLLPF